MLYMFDEGGTLPIVQRGGTFKKGGAGFKKGVRRRVVHTMKAFITNDKFNMK